MTPLAYGRKTVVPLFPDFLSAFRHFPGAGFVVFPFSTAQYHPGVSSSGFFPDVYFCRHAFPSSHAHHDLFTPS